MTEDVSFTGVPERIEVADVIVRRFTPADLPALVAAVNVSLEELRPWMAWAQSPATVDDYEERDWIGEGDRQWRAGTGFNYGIFATSGEFLGGVGFHVRNGPGVLEIGYWLRSDQQGRGLMTAVAGALTQAATTVPDVTRVEIHCDPANHRSAAIPQRLGYELREVREVPQEAPGQTGKLQIWAIEVTEVAVS
ncbi:MAG TPA: GNAT family N-acetyltransferase [Mycobacteriales bacterium]|nr:GNAT family N-acetyltransferase [Mycobacteriales bacterium]